MIEHIIMIGLLNLDFYNILEHNYLCYKSNDIQLLLNMHFFFFFQKKIVTGIGATLIWTVIILDQPLMIHAQ